MDKVLFDYGFGEKGFGCYVRQFDKYQKQKSVADEPFYIPGFLEKKPTEKQLRRVSDITTEMLRGERYFCYSIGKMMWTEEYKEYFRLKLERIHIRLSIKQTKP